VCCFGTQNLNEDKLTLAKMQGVDQVDIFMDGDEAGQKAAADIKILCEKVGLESRNVHLKGTDPGALNEAQVRSLEKKLYA
jgi:DNA primase